MRMEMGASKDARDDYDAWFRAKVQEALEDQRRTVPHAEVMRDMRELIGRKKEEGGLAPTLPA